MQPNDQYQPAPSGIDYLYQIAPQAPPPNRSNKTKFITIAIVAAGMLLVSLILILATNSSQVGPSPIKLAARLQKMQTISQNFSKKLRATEVQDINSSLSAILLSANQAINEPLLEHGVDAKKQAKEITALDPTEELEQKLNDAALNSQLDTTYTREMYFLLEDTLIMMETLHGKAQSESMKAYLEKFHSDFTNLKKRFEALTSAESESSALYYDRALTSS